MDRWTKDTKGPTSLSPYNGQVKIILHTMNPKREQASVFDPT